MRTLSPGRFAGPVRGSALLITLLFMTILALLVVTVLEAAGLQLRLAVNHQGQEQSLNYARALAIEVSQRKDNFMVDSGVGQRNCLAEDPAADCDLHTLSPVTVTPIATGLQAEYHVIRRDPLLRAGLPTRDPQSRASSVRRVSTALFDVNAAAGDSVDRRGWTRVTRGVALTVNELP